MYVFMQSFNDILFWHEHIFKVDHLKQVYLTKLTDDARKNICHSGQNRNTRLHFTREKSIQKHTVKSMEHLPVC